MNVLEKIQKLPKRTRKIIFWTVLILITFIFSFFFIKNIQNRLQGLKTEDFKEDFKIPALEEELKNLPKFEKENIPNLLDINEEKQRPEE